MADHDLRDIMGFDALLRRVTRRDGEIMTLASELELELELDVDLDLGEGDPSTRLADQLRMWIAGMGSEVASSS